MYYLIWPSQYSTLMHVGKGMKRCLKSHYQPVRGRGRIWTQPDCLQYLSAKTGYPAAMGTADLGTLTFLSWKPCLVQASHQGLGRPLLRKDKCMTVNNGSKQQFFSTYFTQCLSLSAKVVSMAIIHYLPLEHSRAKRRRLRVKWITCSSLLIAHVLPNACASLSLPQVSSWKSLPLGTLSPATLLC